jgi:hypothetical protein
MRNLSLTGDITAESPRYQTMIVQTGLSESISNDVIYLHAEQALLIGWKRVIPRAEPTG